MNAISLEHEGTEDKQSMLYKIRHSLAHVLAQAIQELRPGTKLGFGPPIQDGLYYDFLLSSPLNDEDFSTIEKKMRFIIKQNQKFTFEDLPYDEAMKKLDDMGEPYKKEYAQELFEKHKLKTLRFFYNGPFCDMCEGPHVDSTSQIPLGGFKVRSLAGAYWRGDAKQQMMTRVYVWAFASKEDLDAQVKAYKLAQERDHKKLGKELDLFHIDDEIGKGLPLWLPNGSVIRDELEKLMVEMEFKEGFQRVHTPHITKSALYHQTGHLPYYKDGMFPTMILEEKKENGEGHEEEYCLKPMNCPHHHKIFSSRMRSYRELPLRLAEYGHVYRYEDSGAVSGLLRVRGMCMNDAHIYCTEDQIKSEFLAVMKMHKDLYKIFGIEKYHMRLSTWDPEDPKGREKFVDNSGAWEKTTQILEQAMKESGLPYEEGKGEGAFYGPKIDFQLRTVTGREETASTNQLDFAVPQRLSLTYTGSDGNEHTPYIIHRAPAGTHERFVAFLIEHFGGAFPLWLAPVQVKVITVAEQFMDYGQKLVDELRSSFFRAELDQGHDSLNKKIRTHAKRKIPCLLIIGEKEQEADSVTLRCYGVKEQKTLPFQQFKAELAANIRERSLSSLIE